MSTVYSQFANYIEQNNLIKSQESVLLAVSGGADSMCMLSLMHEYAVRNQNRIGVVCVNHGFRPEAASEAEFVRTFCEDRNIIFYLKEIEPGTCRNSEEEARIYRYRLINEVAEKEGYDKIALAHNSQDQAETILFNLIRGTGVTGLIGIRPSRDMYIRPILWMNRESIENYLQENGMDWCTDATNLGDDYSRNIIRHHILPQAKQINSGYLEHISHMSIQLERIEKYICTQALGVIKDIVIRDAGIVKMPVEKLACQDIVIRQEIYRQIILEMSPHLKDITAEHIDIIDRLVCRQGNAQNNLPYGIRVMRSYDDLVFMSEASLGAGGDNSSTSGGDSDSGVIWSQRIIDVASLPGDIRECIPRNKYTKWFDYDKINGAVDLRNARDNDTIVIDKDGHRKSLNRYYIEEKIPVYQRDHISVIASETDVLWILGYRDSSAYRVDDSTQRILEIEVRMED